MKSAKKKNISISWCLFQIFHYFNKTIPQYSLLYPQKLSKISSPKISKNTIWSSNTAGNIFSRTSFQWKSTNPRRPISILIIIHGQCIRRLESILGRDYQPIILICSWVEAIGHRLFRVEISSPFAILYSANPPPPSSRRWA